jgi:S1-C subfamily serine protease
VVLAGNRVLVTAQMAADATYIELELPESGQKIPAKVVAVDYEANLALLESPPSDKQKAFFAGLKPMALMPAHASATRSPFCKPAVWAS